jgi:hypothetical protein
MKSNDELPTKALPMYEHPDSGYHQIKLRILRRIQSEQTAEQVLELVRESLRRAMVAEVMVMSRSEQTRMLRDVLDDVMKDILKKL